MATLAYYRSQENDIQIFEDRKFDMVIDVTRSDSENVTFTGKTIKMVIYDRRGGTLIDTLTSGTEITIAVNRLTFAKTFTALENKVYYYMLFNDTDKIGISHGNLIVL